MRNAVRIFNTAIGIANSVTLQMSVCRNPSKGNRLNMSTSKIFKKALLVSRITYLEHEKLREPDITDEELENKFRSRNSDYDLMLNYHLTHKRFEADLARELESAGIETKIVNRYGFTDAELEWADVIIPTGGDGTFLFAASRILDNVKPVVGLNSDPNRSEGHLCLPKKYSHNIREAVKKIKEGEFEWKFRSRIRISLSGTNVSDPPVELHEQEVSPFQYLERYDRHSLPVKNFDLKPTKCKTKLLPHLALNEVFIGECLSARVSYFALCVDDGTMYKVKSSGICIATGTGSTSWNLSINRITQETVSDIARLLGKNISQDEANRILKEYNDNLIFDPEERKMAYTLRDTIYSGVWPRPRDLKQKCFASKIEVRSRCLDAGLVIDGGMSYTFNDGTTAILESVESDSLRTIKIID